jgi:GMP synthase-like glutamine amidotransferase
MHERGWIAATCEIDEIGQAPGIGGVDAIIAMGGPMSVNDEESLPWLADEKQLIGDAVRAGVPYFGACLGVQLLAASLGARVYAGPEPEVGILPVELTDEGRVDPIMGSLDGTILALQWHGDTFDLPTGATLLASSPACPHQAFRFGRLAYGVQFHVEVLPAMAREWAQVPEYVGYADRVLGDGGMERLLAEFDAAEAGMRSTGRSMFARWAELAVPVAR